MHIAFFAERVVYILNSISRDPRCCQHPWPGSRQDRERQDRQPRARTPRPQIEVPEDATPQYGFVVARQQNYGFIKNERTRIFFHVSDSDAASGGAALNDYVGFVIGRDAGSGRTVACRVETLTPGFDPSQPRAGGAREAPARGPAPRPPQARPAAPRAGDTRGPPPPATEGPPAAACLLLGEELLPGTQRGVVAVRSRSQASVRLDDGVILYSEPGQDPSAQHQAHYGNFRVQAGQPAVLENDAVEFEVTHSSATLARKAVNIRLVGLQGGRDGVRPGTPEPSAAELPPPGAERLLGRIVQTKKEFGFIRQLDRPGDIFFHFSQLQGIPPDQVTPGLEVEYGVRRDAKGQLSAVGVTPAPPGSVVFEVVAPEVLAGVVLERPGAGPGNDGAGVLGCPAGAGPRRVLFHAADVAAGARLRPGDHVLFRLATDVRAARAAAAASSPAGAAMAGRRAVGVEPVALSGRVLALPPDRGFGFLGALGWRAGAAPRTLGPAPAKLYFQLREVAPRGEGEPELRPGDELEGVLHTSPKGGEPLARCLARTRCAPPDTSGAAGGGAAAGGADAPPPPRPRLFAGVARPEVGPAARQPRGPDAPDAVGFALPRTVPCTPPVPGFELVSRRQASAAAEAAAAEAAAAESTAAAAAALDGLALDPGAGGDLARQGSRSTLNLSVSASDFVPGGVLPRAASSPALEK
ncbi:hypothetical protein ACKKBG_A04595 [Auxenochlorella protothecoides x Auxenochlorella symbiontica]